MGFFFARGCSLSHGLKDGPDTAPIDSDWSSFWSWHDLTGVMPEFGVANCLVLQAAKSIA